MYTINDPIFALILRFVGRNQKITFRDDEFTQKQLKAIQAHIDQFPAGEEELHALEWIEAHAREYRKRWEKEILGKEFLQQRCPDCPLVTVDDAGHCQIHEDWFKLLQQYAADEISSTEYVESALALLARHKKDLKNKLSALKTKGG